MIDLNKNAYILPSSFDSMKVKLDFENGIVYKKSSDKEFLCMKHFGKNLDGQKLVISGVKLQVVEILDFNRDSKLLITKYEEGINLELALIYNLLDREKIIFLFRELYLLFIKIGLLQLDFAPRNIIFNEEKNTLFLLDFERGFADTNNLNSDELKFLLSFSISEEMNAFLNEREIKFVLGNIFDLNISNIRDDILNIIPIGKRRKNIVDKIMGIKKNIVGKEEIINYLFINYFFNKYIQLTLKGEKMIYLLEKMSPVEIEENILFFIYNKLGQLKLV